MLPGKYVTARANRRLGAYARQSQTVLTPPKQLHIPLTVRQLPPRQHVPLSTKAVVSIKTNNYFFTGNGQDWLFCLS